MSLLLYLVVHKTKHLVAYVWSHYFLNKIYRLCLLGLEEPRPSWTVPLVCFGTGSTAFSSCNCSCRRYIWQTNLPLVDLTTWINVSTSKNMWCSLYWNRFNEIKKHSVKKKLKESNHVKYELHTTKLDNVSESIKIKCKQLLLLNKNSSGHRYFLQ